MQVHHHLLIQIGVRLRWQATRSDSITEIVITILMVMLVGGPVGAVRDTHVVLLARQVN